MCQNILVSYWRGFEVISIFSTLPIPSCGSALSEPNKNLTFDCFLIALKLFLTDLKRATYTVRVNTITTPRPLNRNGVDLAHAL